MSGLAMHTMDNAINFTLEYVFEKLGSLPSFPKVVQEALSRLDDPNVAMKDIAEILKYDPGVTANILKITNSAAFGLSRQVTNLETALSLLGEHQLRNVLMASASLPYLSVPIRGYGMDSNELWMHSMGTAIIAEEVAGICGEEAKDILFTAALLHDIGKVVMNMFVGPRLDELITLSRQEQRPFSELEWELLGGDHAVIGSNVLENWEFPLEIVRMVRSHHDPDIYIQDKLSSMLALSNIIATQLGLGVGADSFRYHLSEKLLPALKLDRQGFEELMVNSIIALDKSASIMSLYES